MVDMAGSYKLAVVDTTCLLGSIKPYTLHTQYTHCIAYIMAGTARTCKRADFYFQIFPRP